MEPPSFESVYEDHFDFIWSSARQLGVRTGAMDDVVLEIFKLIHAKLHVLRQPERVRSRLYGIVRQVVQSQLRAHERSGVVLKSDLAGRDEARVEPAERNQDVICLSNLLAELDAVKREVFVLAELHEMSVAEIADVLALPPDIVHSQLRTARLVVEAKLARRSYEESGDSA